METSGQSGATIYYHRVPEMWRKTEKLAFVAEAKNLSGIAWQTLQPDDKHNWLTEGMQADFATFLPMGSKEAKAGRALTPAGSQRERELDLPSPFGSQVGGEGVAEQGVARTRSEKPSILPAEILQRCRELRRNATDAEQLVWSLLRGRQIANAKFRRQHPHGAYILDFYCHEARLAIELDGGGHAEEQQQAYDAVRTSKLEADGIRVLRFWNNEVLQHTERVLEVIWKALTLPGTLTPALTPGTLTPGTLTPALSQRERESDLPSPFGRGAGGEGAGREGTDVQVIFKTYSRGVATSRDDWAYSFNHTQLVEQVKQLIETYNSEVDRWQRRSNRNANVDDFVLYDDKRIKWSRDLKLDLQRARLAAYSDAKVRNALYRPFCKQHLFFDRVLNEEVYALPSFFPTPGSEQENVVIWLKVGSEVPMFALMTNTIPDLLPQGGSQCFPFYVYDEDGGNRRENITDWALAQFASAVRGQGSGVSEQGSTPKSNDAQPPTSDPRPGTKKDIFHYIYAVLHHPEYRARYAENLKRELPRIPLVGAFTASSLTPTLSQMERESDLPSAPSTLTPTLSQTERESDLPSPKGRGAGGEGAGGAGGEGAGGAGGEGAGGAGGGDEVFWHFADIGARLAELHLNYERAPEYPLRAVENKAVPWTWRVTKMRLTKDRDAVIVNEALTLTGVPPQAFDYRLGNRSALEWVLDQYQVSTDKRSGVTSDPNRADDEEYIVRLVAQVISVSVETMKLVAQLAAVPLAGVVDAAGD